MTHLNGRVTIMPEDRLFEPVRQLLTLTSCVGIAALAVQSGRTPEMGNNFFPSRMFGVTIVLPARGPVELALADEKPDRIEILIERASVPPPPEGAKSKSLFPLLGLIASVVFTNFYEGHRQWLKTHLPADVSQWPAPLNFGRKVRNFISHSGKVHFEKPTSAAVGWHSASYSPADNGRVVIGTKLQYPELLILMIEMTEQLDLLGAPVP